MKKNIFVMLALFAGSMLFTACSNENKLVNENSNLKSMTFLAGTESDATRAVLDGLTIEWASGDAIGIYDGTSNNEFVLTDGVGSTSGTFSGSAADVANYFAVAPYVSTSALSSTNITGYSIPATQTAVDNGIDPSLLIMMGKTTDKSNIQFKNALSYIKVQPKFNCSAITLTSNGSENIAGDITLGWNEDKPTVSIASNGSTEISLTGTITADNIYYIAVCPGTLANGFSISFSSNDANGTIYTRSTGSHEVVFARNKVNDLGEFTKAGPWTNGIAKRTGNIDVNWVQLWDGGPKFAEYNVDASTPTEYQYLFFRWGETASRSSSLSFNTWEDYADASFTKYNASGTTKLDTADDAATANWGSNWRLPEPEEFGNMLSNCTCVWTTKNSKNGLLVTGNGAYSSNSIFFTACGSPDDLGFENLANVGIYMTNSLSNSDSSKAICFMFYKDGSKNANYFRLRCYGQSVRPVYVGQ